MSSSLVPLQEKSLLALGRTKLELPDRTAKLLFVSRDPAPTPQSGLGISFTIDILDGKIHVEDLSPDEPSTMYTAMPIRRPPHPSIIPRPPYYPSYAGLTPEQRWIYLNWLTDVTKPVNVGYVFIYYYGLERHLLIGDFELAFDEILLLRQSHSQNGSFDSYSRSALLNSALFRKSQTRLELLYRLAPPGRFDDTDLVLAYRLGYDLGIEGLMRLVPSLRGVEKRYLKSKPFEYKTALSCVLTEEFGEPFLPFASRYSISDVPKRSQILFANISFPSEIRTPALASFLNHQPFLDEASRLLALAHERTKANLAEARKPGRRVRSA
ncbi:MAG TPA: TerB N-terminal domain-containing protein [Anaerolineales bacterium]|nr:TerB N-terminal domain-containing protein [Anaerolineales bacterium]